MQQCGSICNYISVLDIFDFDRSDISSLRSNATGQPATQKKFHPLVSESERVKEARLRGVERSGMGVFYTTSQSTEMHASKPQKSGNTPFPSAARDQRGLDCAEWNGAEWGFLKSEVLRLAMMECGRAGLVNSPYYFLSEPLPARYREILRQDFVRRRYS